MQKIKKEKGITMIALVITIVVMLLISVPTIIYTINLTDVNKLTQHKEDFDNLAETVSQVYAQGESISDIGPKYTGSIANCTNPNDDNNYYVINVDNLKSKLDNKYKIKMKDLYFGQLNNNPTSSATGDVYIINEKSRTIYYLEGFKNSKGQTIYTYPEEYTEITVYNYVKNSI